MAEDRFANGVLVGGGDNGCVYVWDPSKLMKDEDCLLHKLDKHVGAVAAIDVNPFQVSITY